MGRSHHFIEQAEDFTIACDDPVLVSEKLKAIPELLDKIQIKGRIITIDAMGMQKAITEKIRKKRADYVLTLKGNRAGLYEDVELYFGDGETRKGIRKKGIM